MTHPDTVDHPSVDIKLRTTALRRVRYISALSAILIGIVCSPALQASDDGPSLDAAALGEICQEASDDRDAGSALGAQLVDYAVSASLVVQFYDTALNLIAGRISPQTGAETSEYVLSVEARPEQVPAGLKPGDRITVHAVMKDNQFFDNPTGLCFVKVAAEMIAASESSPQANGRVASEIFGTPFRGVALGQSRDDVERALGAIGQRCMTEAEKQRFDGSPLIENILNWDACRIIPADADAQTGFFEIYFDFTMLEMYSQQPLNSVVFENGLASSLHLQPSFFDADRMDRYAFAKSIVENYMNSGSLTVLQSGYSGEGKGGGDLVEVHVSPRGQRAVVIVRAKGAPDTPVFD